MKYSEYAPTWLIESHKNMQRRYDNKEYLDDFMLGRTLPLLDKFVDSRNDAFMSEVWSEIDRREEDMDEAGTWFFNACWGAYSWPDGFQCCVNPDGGRVLTQREKKKEIHAIQKDAERLMQRLKYYLAADLHVHDLMFTEKDIYNWYEDKDFTGLTTMSVSHLLDVFINKLNEHANAPLPTAKPNSERAREAVFVRRLTASMKERYHKPLQKVVAQTACMVFDDGSIDEKFVQNNSK